MKTIVLASNNPVKARATLNGFKAMFPSTGFELKCVDIPSGVSRQPMGDDETLLGARTRAGEAEKLYPQADYCVGIECGVEEKERQLGAFAWIVIRSGGKVGIAKTATFFLPKEVSHLIRSGMELGDADDAVFNRSNSKQENGAIGLLTGNIIDRARLYEPAVIMALIPFKNPQLY